MQVVVSDKGQITLPQALRRQLGIEPGSRLEIDPMSDGSLRVRALTRGAGGLAGLLHRPGAPAMTLEAMDEGIAAAAAERDARSRPVPGE
jgi:AbrB family looped-hinge helix DNA binding protein